VDFNFSRGLSGSPLHRVPDNSKAAAGVGADGDVHIPAGQAKIGADLAFGDRIALPDAPKGGNPHIRGPGGGAGPEQQQ
jgi:hypothetical protein